MAIANYTKGFANGVAIRGVPLAVSHPGKAFWVDSNAPGGKGTFDRPMATIDAAVGLCTANKGDIIFVKPGHVETVTAAAGLALDVAGIAVVGLGSGAARPKINFTTATTADMDVDAASVTVYNVLFTGGIDALAGPIDVNAADFSLLSCEYRDVTGQATDVIVADANAHRLLIEDYFHNGAAAAGADSAIALTGMSNPVIRNFKIVGNFAVSAIDCRTTAVVDLDINDGYIWTKNAADLCIKDTITASTGKVGPYLNFMLTDNAANVTESVTGATFHLFAPILVCNLAGEQGMAINTTTTTDA
jgi:hypothetical protein